MKSLGSDLTQQLLRLGLSDKEARAYLSLLSSGTQATSLVAKHAGLNRGTAHVCLHQLLERGLVTKSSKRGIQHFTALDPSTLLNYLDRRASEIQNQRHSVEQLMQQLHSLANPFTSYPKVRFFDGVEGARTVLESTLKAKDQTLRAFLSVADIVAFLGDSFFQDYTRKRIKRGYTLHAIRTIEKDKQASEVSFYAQGYVTSKMEQREVRYLSDKLAFPITTYIFDNQLAIISSKAEKFALLIESAELTSMQRQLFLLMWKTAKLGKPA